MKLTRPLIMIRKMVTIFLLVILFFFLAAGVVAGPQGHDQDDDQCMPTSCGDNGPDIRFPFWLKDHQPDRCGYGPGFALTCSPANNDTLLDLPFSTQVVVVHIDYKYQEIVYRFSGCIPYQNLSLSLTTSPFSSPYDNYCDYHIFTCPSFSVRYDPQLCLPGRYVYQNGSDDLAWRLLLNCTKMYSVRSVPCYNGDSAAAGGGVRGYLYWSEPHYCSKCEAEGMYCSFIRNYNNSTEHETGCFPIPKSNSMPPTGERKSQLVRDLIPPCLFLLVVVLVAIYFLHRSTKSKKEDQVKIERFLEDYRALKPTRYTYAEIKRITDNFKNKLGQGGYGTVYKGKLSDDIYVAAKILNNFTGNGDDFINEMGTIGTIHHINVVRLVGYCADGYKKALVYEYLPNDSLQHILSFDQKKQSLGWEKLQDIALGIAKGIEYLHQGCDQRILHFDIKPHNILLDKNFNPKISDFGLAKLCSKEQSAISLTAARGTVGYIAPEVFSRNFGNVSHKSDVYSFGMLLLEMVGEKKNNTNLHSKENSDEVYFPEWIYKRLSREEENTSIDEDGDAKIVKKLTIVGLGCIQWYPTERPSMKVVVQMLEGDGDTLVVPPNPFSTTNAPTARGNKSEKPFSSILEIISESD